MLSRIGTVFGRFGISSKRFERLLYRYATVTRNLDCVPTFPITAVTLKRHPKLIRELYQQGIEFAVHGYIHTDYGVLPLKEQMKHFKKAINVFEWSQLPFTGFRAPFLRINNKTPQALRDLGFPYDSSSAVHWDVFDETKYTRESWREYEKLLNFYQSRQANDYLVLPRIDDSLVEIPVSIPDDEAMVERLGIIDRKEISEIWGSVLERVYNGGELFTLQLHPERIIYCENALADVIQKAKELIPSVWTATLQEIAGWWRERDSFAFEINSKGDGKYRIEAKCTERATILIKNCRANVPVNQWFDSYQSITARDFIIESPLRPVIGVRNNSSPAAVTFLKREGYIIERSDNPDNYGIYFNNLSNFSDSDEKPLSQEIDKANNPLLRYWRWPDQARSALCVTGDIDSITLIDFVLRICENSLENWRQRSR